MRRLICTLIACFSLLSSTFAVIVSRNGNTDAIVKIEQKDIKSETLTIHLFGESTKTGKYYKRTGLKKDAVKGITGVKKVIIEEGIYFIEDGAFSEMPDLEEVVLPSTITSFGKGVFKNDPNLKKVTYSSELIEFPEQTFYNCSNLTTLENVSQVEVIGKEAFFGVNNLEYTQLANNIAIGNTPTNIESVREDSSKEVKIPLNNHTYIIIKNGKKYIRHE